MNILFKSITLNQQKGTKSWSNSESQTVSSGDVLGRNPSAV